MPTLNPEKWREVKEIFYAALQRAPEEREEFLNQSCQGDPHLRSEVESLLASSEDAGSFMRQPAVGEHATVIAANEQLHLNQSLGHYRILKLLGEGGMGQVYLAEDTRLERKVALKILPAHFAGNAERMRRFVREAKAASALNQPNILTIYESGAIDHTNYIASEYVAGETLNERLRREPLSLKVALEVAIQIASALQAAHEANIVHRDIKPDNVMIRPDGLVKILDFGVAKLTDKPVDLIDPEAATAIHARTNPGTIVGTAAYMSPEQARGKAVDARSDLFSFGLVFYEMLTGKKAFAGDNAMDIISCILHKEPVPLSQLLPDAPSSVDRLVAISLRKNCEERYQSAKALLNDLKEARQEVEFQNQPQRVPRLHHVDPEAQVSKEAITESAPTTLKTTQLFSRINNHKLAFVALSVLLLVAVGFSYWYFSDRPASNKPFESIAVMPFINESGNAEIDYLSDGITETLISSLSQLPGLNVKARSSVFRYKGKEVHAQTIGKELKVQALLNGRVVQRGPDLTFYVELVDAATENSLWKHTYHKTMTDLLVLQNDISRDVADKLRIKLTGADEQKLKKNYTENAEAYQLYLRGRYFWNRRNEEGIKKAIEQFQQAIERDPNYALGYVGLADSYVFLGEFTDAAPGEMLTKARAAADRALQLDDSLAEAHASSAIINRMQWRWAEAEEEFRRALSLNPNYANAHLWFSILLRNKRKFADALKEIQLAEELDPLSPVISANVAYVFVLTNNAEAAVEQCKRMLELDPNVPLIHELLGIAYLKQERRDEAIAQFEKAVELTKRANSRYLSSLGYGYGVAGRRTEALAILKELEEKNNKREAGELNIAGVYAGLGEQDKAFAWLEKSFAKRGILLPEVTWRYAFDGIRNDPRYLDLVRRMGLTL